MLKELIVRFDARLTVAITGWPQWLRTPFLAVSFIGQPVCVIFIALCVAAFNLSNTPIIVAIAATLGAMLLNTLLKHFVHRPRPDTLYVSNMYFKSSSFPSGHAFGTVVVFGFIGYVAAMYIAPPLGAILATLIWLITIAIGISRVYLGAHYPTDVVAGWLLGGLLLGIIIGVVHP